MKAPLLAALVLLLASAAAAQDNFPPIERAQLQPQNCSGWPEPRMWIEAQQWWTNDGEDINSESQHFHLGGCMPYNQTLTGLVTIDVLFQIHNNPVHQLTEIFALAPAAVDTDQQLYVVDTNQLRIGTTGPVSFSCPPESARTCQRVFRLVVDTALVPVDCVAPLRLRADVRPLDGVPDDLSKGVGYGYVPELSFKVRYTNGQPACPRRSDPNYIPEATTIAAGFNDFPWGYSRLSINRDVLPTRPLSGVWTIRQLQSFDLRQQNRITPIVAPVTRSFVTISPRFHYIDPVTQLPAPILGRVVLDVPDMIYDNIRIDTRQLANGRYVLFFRSDAYIAPGTVLPDEVPWLPGTLHAFSGGRPHPGGTSSAVLTFAFDVLNPVAPSPSPSAVA